MLAMVIDYLTNRKNGFFYFLIQTERKEQERKDKKNKDRKDKEDASNGNLLIILHCTVNSFIFQLK